MLKKIERNKKLREKQKEKEAKQKAAKRRTIEQRQIKRQIKASIIPVPEQSVDDFIDKSFIENEVLVENEKHSNKKEKDVPASLEGFTILGGDSLAQTKKVINGISLQQYFLNYSFFR